VLKNNTVARAKTAKTFKISTTITSAETESFAGYTCPEELFSGVLIKISVRTARETGE
jgi:hypothetical protein